MYDGKVVSMPILGQIFTVLYRKDVLAARNRSMAHTWEQLADLAEHLNGTDFDGVCV